jgi:imidazole glycerol phosphate synthase glutamine amidotransferase subunit
MIAGILALGAANVRSIEGALERIGVPSFLVRDAQGVALCDLLVLPGVSHLGFVIDEMDRRCLRKPLADAIAAGVPTLGICAGYQLLFDRSEEAPQLRGLGIFEGGIRRLRSPKLPHMGWNLVESDDASFESGWAYFAHTYAAMPGVETIAQTPVAGERFASVSRRGSVTGVQFHPERSGAYGARMLANFVRGEVLA